MTDDRTPAAGGEAGSGPHLPGPHLPGPHLPGPHLPGPPWRPGRPEWPEWPEGARSRRYPWLSAVLVAIVQLVGSTVVARNQSDRTSLDALGYALLLAGPALLVLLVYLTAGYPYGPVFVSVVAAFFTAMAAGHRRAVLTIAGVLLAAHLVTAGWLYRWLPPPHDTGLTPAGASGYAASMLVVLAAAELARVRREQAEREHRERAQAERRRIDEERLRIARELHDVLAHSISVINVQAGVALTLMDERPEQARTALVAIKAASKEALGEVRHVLGALRAPGDAPRAPAPGLDRLAELVEQAAAAGLVVDTAVDGPAASLPAAADLAAFRILQEALTNVVRHSGARAARIRVTHRPGAVELTVDDDGPATGPQDSGGGHGLVGMRERAAALGGTLSAGPRGDGGFRVHARLPLAPAAADTVGAPTDTEDR